MKTITTLILLGLLACPCQAQKHNQKCKENLSIYDGLVKTNQLEEAYPIWKIVNDSCPAINSANFYYGKKILEFKISNASEKDKFFFIRELLNLHAASRIHFPLKTKATKIAIDTVLIRHKYKMISTKALYDALSDVFEADATNFKNPKALYLLFSSVLELQQSGEKDMEDMIGVYDKVMAKIDNEKETQLALAKTLQAKQEQAKLSAKEESKLKFYTGYVANYDKIANSINSKFTQSSSCEHLIPFYEKRFEKKKKNSKWIKKAVQTLFKKECLEAPIFNKLFQQQLLLDPSADGYLYSGLLKQKKGDEQGALKEYNKALDLETEISKKCDIAYKIALLYRKKSPSESRKYALKAIKLCPSYAKVYLLISQLYHDNANLCGTTAFEKRAMYWKAAEMARKTINADDSVDKELVKKHLASCMAKAPTREMIFNADMAGKKLDFNCWVGGNITVPGL